MHLQKVIKNVNIVNLFHATGLFLYPLKTPENQRLSDVFRHIEGKKWNEMG